MQNVQSAAAPMPTAAELLTAYNAITYNNVRYHATPEHAKDLARAIIQGDTSGKLPAKREQITMEDCEGEYFIPAILATKPGRLAPAAAVAPMASHDTLRPAMNCVYYDATRGAAVATCGHVLLSFPCGPLAPASALLHPVTLEPLKVGDVVNKEVMSKSAVDTRYPDYVNVIRLPNPNGPAATLDVQAFRNQLAGIARAERFVNLYTGIRARIQHEGQDFYVDAALCGNALKAMQASGTTRVHLDLSQPARALQFTDVDDANKLALIMPVQGPDRTYYKEGFAFCHVLDTAAGQVSTSPVAVKRVTVKKPVQPRAVQVLSKEEKRSLAASVKQYEAADTAEQARMLTKVKETVSTHIAHLRQSALRQLAAGEIHNIHTSLRTDALFFARVGRAFLATIAPPIIPALTTPAPVEVPAEAPVAAGPNFDNASTIEEFSAAMDNARWDSLTRLRAMTKLKRGQRVSIFLESDEATVTSRDNLDYWVKYDDGTRALHSRGDLTEVHQIGQPITHAPTIAALTELVALATAQVQERPITTPAPAADGIALLTEHQGGEYSRTANDDEPDELIRARHGEPSTALIPAPTMSPTQPPAGPVRNGRNPFRSYHDAGDRVRPLHRVGKCAVALIYQAGAPAGFYALRFRQYTVEANSRADLPGAFAHLRAQDRAEVAYQAERVSWGDALPLAESPACLLAFCAAHGLNPDLDYRRDELRRAITSRKLPKMAHYLNTLSRTTTTVTY